MGRRGPAPKPTALKIAAGNPGRRKLNTAEPVPPSGAPDAPAWLDERARSVWDQLVPGLARVGLARRIDGTVLGRYCSILVLWTDAIAWVREHGQTYTVRAEAKESAKGVVRPGRIVGFREFPQLAEVRKLSQLLLGIEREFGLTPAARTRIQVEAEKSSKGDANELKRRFFATGGGPTPPPSATVQAPSGA